MPEGIRIVMMNRHRAAVAASLAGRFGISLEVGRTLCDIYTERAKRYAIRYRTYSVQYEDLFLEKQPSVFQGLSQFLGISTDLESIASKTVDPSLRHHQEGKCSNSNYAGQVQSIPLPQ